MTLEPCRDCRRHVATTARACPFCGGAGAAASGRPRPTGRKTRKAIAVLSLALVGCSGSDETTTGGDTGIFDTGTGDAGTGDTGTGDTGTGDTGGPADTGAATDGGGDAKADAGADATDAVADSGPVDTGFLPPYGHPPWDEAFV